MGGIIHIAGIGRAGLTPQPAAPGGVTGLGKRTVMEALGPGGEQGADEAPPGVRVSFSPEGLARTRGDAEDTAPEETERPGELSEEEQGEVRDLKQRDAEVRRHEQAHVAAGGQYVRGGAQFEYTRGPDGRQYATGGEVSIDVSEARTPEATITKAQIVRRAALAPAKPSAQDRGVAAAASRMETAARGELAKQRVEEARQASEEGTPFGPAMAESPFTPEAMPGLDGGSPGPSGPRTLDVRA